MTREPSRWLNLRLDARSLIMRPLVRRRLAVHGIVDRIIATRRFASPSLLAYGSGVLAFAWSTSDAAMSVPTDGLAGAGSLIVRAIDAPSMNPAVLAWDASLMIRAAGSIELQNDTYRWDDYRRWNGARWSDEDKEAILSRIDGDGVAGRVAYGAQLPAVAFRGWALSTTSRHAARATVPREYAELVLRGNRVGEHVDLASSTAEEIQLTDVTLSHGRTIGSWSKFTLSSGANLHYLRAGDLRELVSLTGSVVTTEDVLDGNVIAESRTAEGGNGFAIDLGFAARTGQPVAGTAQVLRDGGVELGVMVTNLFSSVEWSERPRFHLDSAFADSLTLDDVDGAEDLVEVEGRATTIPAFDRSLAREVAVSAGFRRGDVRFDSEARIGLDDDPFVSTEPRAAVGASFLRWAESARSKKKDSIVVPRCGIALGGIDGPVLAFGVGLDVERFHFDVAYRNLGNFHLLLPKGVGLGLSVSYTPRGDTSTGH